MDARSVQRSISKSWRIVAKLGLGASFSNPTSLQVPGEIRDLALTEGVRYEEIYQKGLELVFYNFMLTDYSYFQFSWLGRESVRYAFYPNPFTKARTAADHHERLSELVRAGFLTHEEYLTIISDHHVSNRYPMFRYEHAENEYRAFHHPCAHLHIGHPPRGRWCVARALSPYAFTLLILKHHYTQEWQSVGADHADATGNVFESALLEERTSSREIAPEFLSHLERRTFRLD
jgi:hypothetical protein